MRCRSLRRSFRWPGGVCVSLTGMSSGLTRGPILRTHSPLKRWFRWQGRVMGTRVKPECVWWCGRESVPSPAFIPNLPTLVIPAGAPATRGDRAELFAPDHPAPRVLRSKNGDDAWVATTNHQPPAVTPGVTAGQRSSLLVCGKAGARSLAGMTRFRLTTPPSGHRIRSGAGESGGDVNAEPPPARNTSPAP